MIIDIVPQLAAIIFLLGVLWGLLKDNPRPWGNFIDQYNVYSDIPRWISVTVYLWLSERFLSGLKTKNDGQQYTDVKWLRHFVRIFLVFQLIWLLYLIPYVIPRYTDFMLDTFDWYPIYVPLALLIYWLGIKGYSMSYRLASRPPAKGSPSQSLSGEIVAQSIRQLQKAMEEDKLFLDRSFSLQRLSAHTGIPQKTISAVLNQHIDKSFNEFVNSYRVSTVKTSMLKPESRKLTIAALAFDAGFNSLATFQRAFKASENMTPKEFLSLHEKKRA
ncbi:AraC-like DNA-binding protein [Anseongella ginsenosidimutans]|uniref:AraC-like DNA-binding protein n=1 Tax=Anseongella ginsenosidimutans TaxID=496056 RepID=A0A4R3KPX4_9SPHI|nr:helix-turn-helix domain-containing protein [Anseongella ginsenosidimutans]QEC52235.1 helix-turn-helix domain-containing protein [Anseongella ginsenosidimutans]TCS86786.1 AraC-like DNA-binding protein [Anseongella ginsenosidimutans]